VCLTEDYESGFQMHRWGVPNFRAGSCGERGFVATREYFPRKFRAAVRQRTRWITGISLQSWQRHGWRDTASSFIGSGDRKGLIGNLAAPFRMFYFSMERSPGFGVNGLGGHGIGALRA